MNPFTPYLMSLFQGNMEAYGKFTFSDKIREDGKVKGKGVTIRGPVTPVLWDEHLAGTNQLGIIPITPDSTARFGAIDIDDYDVDKERLNATIVKYKLPVILFRSKSGGAHLFMFINDFVDAGLIQKKLKEIVGFIGYGNAEIFPKQTKILKERGDIGQWINMPYFDSHKTQRFAYNSETGKQLNTDEFVMYAKETMISPETLDEFRCPVLQELPHGPPCLQTLITSGFPDGTRNQGLLNLAIYAKKAFPDTWQGKVEEYNQKFMKPPLSSKEVLTTIGSLNKKEYNYSCKKTPICEHCNVSLCRTRKYGVGENSSMPTMSNLTKLDSNPPIWFIDTDIGRLELNTDELQNPMLFQRKLLQSQSTYMQIPRKGDWGALVQMMLENLTVIPVPSEATPEGQMMEYLYEFCENKCGSEEITCMLRGLVWNNDNLHHFRLNDFVQFLDRKKFYEFSLHKIASVLRDNKVYNRKMSIHRGKNIGVYCAPIAPKSVELPEFPTPNIPSDSDTPF